MSIYQKTLIVPFLSVLPLIIPEGKEIGHLMDGYGGQFDIKVTLKNNSTFKGKCSIFTEKSRKADIGDSGPTLM